VMPRKKKDLQKNEVYDELYHDWLDYLLTGFNILVRGRGSKVELVDKFCECLPSSLVVNIYGHLSGESIKNIMKKIVSVFKLETETFESAPGTIDYALDIAREMEERKLDGFLVIHNLDSNNLRNPLVIEILSVLVQGKQLRLIATLSCLHGDVYWNQEIKRTMRFVEYIVTTNKYVEDEFYDLNPKLASTGSGKSAFHTSETLDSIWTALPQKSQATFLTLYRLIKDTDDGLVQYHELLEEVKKDLWTLNEQTLNQLLSEFVSHEVIKKDMDGAISFMVKSEILANFVESKITS